MTRRTLPLKRILALLLVSLPGAVHAHSSVQGLGEFPNGIIHPFTTPSHLLILIGIGLLVGQQTPHSFKPAAKMFLSTAGIALLLTLSGRITAVPLAVMAGIGLVIGALVALAKPMPTAALAAVFVATAVAIGFDSVVETGSMFSAVQTLLGTWVAIALIVFDVAYYVAKWNTKDWQKIGVRVIGSWIAAIALLMVAFSFKK